MDFSSSISPVCIINFEQYLVIIAHKQPQAHINLGPYWFYIYGLEGKWINIYGELIILICEQMKEVNRT